MQRFARAVDEKVMQPIRAMIVDSTQLLISPDGQLNLLPFAALVDEHERYLVERYLITYLTSGRDLLRMQVARQSKSPAVIVADPAFGEPPLITKREEANRNGDLGTQNRARMDYSRMFFGPLPGVNDEVRALRELQSVTAPSILHIATHAFFQSAGPNVSVPRAVATGSDNPLLRSGLALAGANRDESGILTALEASGLNLWGTKLVVLSACDTGLGEVRNGEGVYGLRRALVLAGAESQVMSLWPVSDRSTRDLMISYYKNLTNGQGRGDSLRQAQLQILKSKSRSHPYYWASFIRGAETKSPTLSIPAGTQEVRIELKTAENEYQSYQLELHAVGGKAIFDRKSVKPTITKSGANFGFAVPASKFTSGDYILTLKGVMPTGEVEDVSKSLFRVEKK